MKWTEVIKGPEGYSISGTRFKNGNQFDTPIYAFKNSATIIERQRGKDETYVFINTMSDQHYNRLLKELATFAGSTKKLVNKTARHSFVQFWVSQGLPGQFTSRMVGHTKEDTLKHYFDLQMSDIKKGVSKYDFSTLDI